MSLKLTQRVVLLVFGLGTAAGCGFGGSNTAMDEPSIKVRLLTSLPVSGRWERAAERGLGRIAAELGAGVTRRRALDSADQRDLVIEQGKQSIDLVFCVGPGFENIVFAEAHSFPHTRFVLLPGRANGDNVAGVEFVVEDAAWVAGVVSASLGTGQTAGVLHGIGGAWLEAVESGFAAGYRSTGRRRDVVSVHAADGPWRLAAREVEVALYATDWPETEVLAAAHDAGILLVTIGTDLMTAEPDVVAAAIQVDVAEAMVRIAREAKEGAFLGSVYTFDLGSGVLDVRLNRSMPDANLPAVRQSLEIAKSEVTAGIAELEGLGM
jgi:simple sugar transport system substrate-binding protein/basic membrane protein A